MTLSTEPTSTYKRDFAKQYEVLARNAIDAFVLLVNAHEAFPEEENDASEGQSAFVTLVRPINTLLSKGSFLKASQSLMPRYRNGKKFSRAAYFDLITHLVRLISLFPTLHGQEIQEDEALSLLNKSIPWVEAYRDLKTTPLPTGEVEVKEVGANKEAKPYATIRLSAYPLTNCSVEQANEYQSTQSRPKRWWSELMPFEQRYIRLKKIPTRIPSTLPTVPMVSNGYRETLTLRFTDKRNGEYGWSHWRSRTLCPYGIQNEKERQRLTLQNLQQFVLGVRSEDSRLMPQYALHNAAGESPLMQVISNYLSAWNIRDTNVSPLLIVQTLVTGSWVTSESSKQDLVIEDTEHAVAELIKQSPVVPIEFKDDQNEKHSCNVCINSCVHTNHPVNKWKKLSAIRTKAALWGDRRKKNLTAAAQVVWATGRFLQTVLNAVEGEEKLSKEKVVSDMIHLPITSLTKQEGLENSAIENLISTEQKESKKSDIENLVSTEQKEPRKEAIANRIPIEHLIRSKEALALQNYINEKCKKLTKSLQEPSLTDEEQRRNLLIQRTLLETLRVPDDDKHSPLLCVILREYLTSCQDTLMATWVGKDNLHLSAIELWLVEMIGGVATGSCKSGKDRKGIQMLYLAALKTYYFMFRELPPKYSKEDPSNEKRKRFAQIFKGLFESEYAQQIAESNAKGARALKGLSSVLKRDYRDLYDTIYKSIAFNDEIAVFNDMDKKGFIIQRSVIELNREITQQDAIESLQKVYADTFPQRRQSSNSASISASISSDASTPFDPHTLIDLVDHPKSQLRYADKKTGTAIYQIDTLNTCVKVRRVCLQPHTQTTFMVGGRAQDIKENARRMVRLHLERNPNLWKQSGKILLVGSIEMVDAMVEAFHEFAQEQGIAWDQKLCQRFQLPGDQPVVPAVEDKQEDQLNTLSSKGSTIFASHALWKEEKKVCEKKEVVASTRVANCKDKKRPSPVKAKETTGLPVGDTQRCSVEATTGAEPLRQSSSSDQVLPITA